MATHSVTSTANQDKAIAWKLAEENKRRAALVPPLNPVTTAQLVQAVTADIFRAMLLDYVSVLTELPRDRASQLNAAQVTAIKDILNQYRDPISETP